MLLLLNPSIFFVSFQVHDASTGQPVNTPKSYGKSIKVSDLPDGVARFFPVRSEQSAQGLPKEQLMQVLEVIRKHVAAIQDAFAQLEIRMVGGSFLIIYEGDLERAKQGLLEVGAGEEEGEEGEEDEEDVEDEDDSDEDEENTKPGPPCLVKLIDFAHTKLVPHGGPDKGVLLGMDTTLKLLDGRIAQIKRS